MAHLVISPLINGSITFIRGMYQKISDSFSVGTLREDLLQRIQEIEAQLEELQKDDDLAAKLKVMGIIERAHKSLEICHQTCTQIADQTYATQVLYSGSNKTTVENLQKRLGEIHQDLTGAITFATYQKVPHTAPMGFQAGAYPVTDNVNPPTAVDKPECSIKNDKQMVVKWNESSSSVQYYEIKLNGKKIISVPNSNNQCIIESPIFNRKPGIYTLQVRAINAGGVGEWSDQTTLEYKTEPPNKPAKPKIEPGLDNVQVHVAIPGIDESNGAAVNKIIIRYSLKSTPNDWHDHDFFIVNKTLPCTKKFKISGLKPYTCYSFFIILFNDCGESIPSEPVFVYTIKIPGKPANFHVRQCSYNRICIAWDPPAENAPFVEFYVLYSKKKSERNDQYKPIRKTTNLCAAVNGFQPGTEYNLLIIAVNKNGQCSEEAYIRVKTKPETMEEAIKRLGDFIGWQTKKT